MRKIMEKVMSVKKDGGQEVLMTLGLVALGVVLLLAFSATSRTLVKSVLDRALANINAVLVAQPAGV